MACCEHNCGTCDKTWFDNTIYVKCPHCGSPSVSNLYDEGDDDENEKERDLDEYDESY